MSPIVSQETLERIEAFVQVAVPASGIRLQADEYTRMATDEIVFTLRWTVYARELESKRCRWPRNWWQAVKERWFPAWALRRWPVLYEWIDLTAYHGYPGIKVREQMPDLFFKTLHGRDYTAEERAAMERYDEYEDEV